MRPSRGWLLLSVCFGVLALIVTPTAVRASPPARPDTFPIAEIQLLLGHAVHVGDRVPLAAGQVNDEHARFLWRLIHRPKASKARLSDHAKSETSFGADVPGTFVVQLTVRIRSTRVTATLALTATEASPLVALNTIDVNAQGNPGMTVGSQFYPDTSNGTQFHIVVLDKNTLEEYHNYTLPVTSGGIAQMMTNFSQYYTNLVFVALPASAPTVSSSLIAPLNSALAEIGAVVPEEWFLGEGQVVTCWASNLPNCFSTDPSTPPDTPTVWSEKILDVGSFSVIGIPGMKAGNAWYDSAAQRGTTQGALIGYLTPGVKVGGGSDANAYTFVFRPDQYVLVDSCVSGGPSACVIDVGNQTFPPQAGVNGLNVVLLDRVTLTPIMHKTVTSTAGLAQALVLTSLGQPGHFQFSIASNGTAGFQSDRVVAVIQSVGTGSLTVANNDPVLQLIDQLGGTPETFAAAITQGKPYALVGVASDLPWHGRGIESSPLINSNEPGRSRGVLGRDRMARYTPGADDPTGVANLGLAPIIFQDPTPWPYAGDCAIPFIANQIGVGAAYPDIRSGYPDTDIPWDTLYSLIPAWTSSLLPTSCPDSMAQYNAIKAQLTNEFVWVGAVRSLIMNLQQPFNETQGSNVVNVMNIANQIANSVQPPASSQVNLFWLTVFSAAMGVAATTPGAPAVLGTMAASGTLAAVLLSSPAGSDSPANNIQTQADQLATQLNDQALAHVAALGNVQTILVSDAGKLQTVGTSVLDNLEWQWTPTTTSDAVNALNATTSQAIYSALLPPTWPLWSLKPDLQTEFSSADVTKFGCGENTGDDGPRGVYYIFGSALDANQFHSRYQMLAQTEPAETSTNEVWTFGTLYHDTYDLLLVTLPSTSLTDTLFSTGPDGAAAYPPAWYRETYNPPSHMTCGTVDTSDGNNDIHYYQPPLTFGPAEADETQG